MGFLWFRISILGVILGTRQKNAESFDDRTVGLSIESQNLPRAKLLKDSVSFFRFTWKRFPSLRTKRCFFQDFFPSVFVQSNPSAWAALQTSGEEKKITVRGHFYDLCAADSADDRCIPCTIWRL